MSEDRKVSTEKRDELLAVYREICTNIRTTDDISFTLLKLVPFVALLGSASFTFFYGTAVDLTKPAAVAIIAVSIAAAALTVGLYRWERRNIQKCNWLISRAGLIELALFGKDDVKLHGQFWGMTPANDREAAGLSEIRLSSRRFGKWGKTEASGLVYKVSIAAWFVPMLLAARSVLPPFALCLCS